MAVPSGILSGNVYSAAVCSDSTDSHGRGVDQGGACCGDLLRHPAAELGECRGERTLEDCDGSGGGKLRSLGLQVGGAELDVFASVEVAACSS